MDNSIIIIGAGISGLAAGCYAQMNGYRSQIFELHSLPGGLCSSWVRKDYTLDGCLSYLYGTGLGQPFNQVWQELGVAQALKFIDLDEFIRIQAPDGQVLTVSCDPDRLAAHMKAISPLDNRLIDSLSQAIKQLASFDLSVLQKKPSSLWNVNDWRSFGQMMLPITPAMLKWSLTSAQDFSARFKNPFLRQAVSQMFGWPEIPMMAGIASLGYMNAHNAGFPAGGSLAVAKALEKRYLELGGQINYKSQVEKILVENDSAVGVRLYNDEVHRAGVVISACDGRGTIFYMLGGKYANRQVKRQYDGHLPTHCMIQVSLGVNRDFSTEPHWILHLLDKPLLIAGKKHNQIGVRHYCFDPSLTPPGKSALVVLLRTDYDYWQRIYGHRLYDTEQEQVAEIVVDYMESLYPDLKAAIEVVDVATPLSYERYTGNWMGASTGWLLTKDTMLMKMTDMPKKVLPGLKNFYMAGQWVEPGGSVPMVAMSGRSAIQLVCHADGKEFTAHSDAG